MFVHTLNDNRIPISVLIIPKLAAPIRNSVRAHLRSIPYLQKLPLAHPVTGDENFEISVRIGADYYWKFVQDHIVRGDGPTAVKSQLSYLLSGPLALPQPVETATMHIAIISCTTEKELSNQNSSSFWRSKSTATTMTGNVSNDMFFQHYMRKHIIVQPDGTYILRFPWKEHHSVLPSNYSVCYRRTRSLAHRLAKTLELLKQYGRIIAEQEK